MTPPPASMYFLLVSPFVAVFSVTHETFALKGIENVLAVNIRLLVLPMAGSAITMYQLQLYQKCVLKRNGLNLHS